MKNLRLYLKEAFRVNQDYKPDQYTCQPKDKNELKEIIKERLAKDKNANLNDIDISNIKDMSFLFFELDPHNIDISEWDVSKVEDMHNMFDLCTHFNCNLSNWNVSNVEWMTSMFFGCKNFKGEGLENWNVSKVRFMTYMLYGCDSLKNKPSWYKEK